MVAVTFVLLLRVSNMITIVNYIEVPDYVDTPDQDAGRVETAQRSAAKSPI
jgi:hypothetical protein